MSLLFLENHEKARNAAEQICRNFSGCRPMFDPAGTKMQEIPIDGLTQTIILLDVALELDDEGFFRWCGVWTYVLFADRMPAEQRVHAKGFVVHFCTLLKSQLFWLDTDDLRKRAAQMLDAAIEEIQKADPDAVGKDLRIAGTGSDVGAAYLQKLLDRDISGAMHLIDQALLTYPIETVYTEIIQNIMYEVGELWHRNQITVALEHYCTAATQTILSVHYAYCLDQPKNGHKAVVACIGSELHELGARMVSDLLEYHGWDCIFLGAGVPLDTLLDTLGREQPDMCCLSLALQQGIQECKEDLRANKGTVSRRYYRRRRPCLLRTETCRAVYPCRYFCTGCKDPY
jgi:methanogenic corrinoid protein MtbC1